MSPGLQLARTRDVTALFRDSLVVYGRHAWTFLALSAVVVLPVELIVQGVGLGDLTGTYDDSPTTAATAITTAVGFLVVAPLITAICIHALRSVAAGQRPQARVAILAGFEAFTPLFFAVAMAAIGIAIGLAALIVPGIFLAVRWFFVPQAVVLEGVTGRHALARSWAVVEGFWWRTLGLVILANLAAVLPALVVSAPFAAIAESTDRAVWSLVGSMAAQIVTTPFVALFATLLWFDLQARRGSAPAPAPAHLP